MQVRVEIFTVNKRFPLTIRWYHSSTNVWLRVEEMALRDGGRPFRWGTIGTHRNNPERITASSAGIASIQPVRTTAD